MLLRPADVILLEKRVLSSISSPQTVRTCQNPFPIWRDFPDNQFLEAEIAASDGPQGRSELLKLGKLHEREPIGLGANRVSNRDY